MTSVAQDAGHDQVRGVLRDQLGAVAGSGPDESVAAHYGDPLREQRLLERTAGVVDRSNRGVLAVPGQDRLSWLHSLVTQQLTDLPPWRGTEALVLSPHGHIEHHLQIVDDGQTSWLDVEPDTAPELAVFLDRMRFMLRVDPAVVTGRWAVLSVVGPRTAAALDRIAGPAGLPPGPYDVCPLPTGGWMRRLPWPGADAADLLVPRDTGRDVVDRLGLEPAGLEAFEALRVVARRPRLGWETDHRTIVQEPDWLAVTTHLDKGCYRGQETVARVHNLGRPPRRLVFAHFDGVAEEVPPSGTPVLAGGRVVGRVTTSARHHELGPVALLMIKRSISDDMMLELGEPLAGTRVAIEPAGT